MSQYDPETDNTDEEEQDPNHIVGLSRQDIRALEKKGKAFDEAASERDRLQRELVFTKAGINTETDAGKIFMRGFDGELTLEAVKTAAQSFGLSGAPAEQPEAAKPDTELAEGEEQMTQERSDLGSPLNTHDEGIKSDPNEEAIQIGQKIITSGGKFEEGVGAAFNFLAKQAQEGDNRVIIDRRSPAGRN